MTCSLHPNITVKQKVSTSVRITHKCSFVMYHIKAEYFILDIGLLKFVYIYILIVCLV